jgi:predicted ATPase
VAHALQQGARLVTLIGPGGVGKTRLAIEVAAAMQPRYAEGAVFVDLSPVEIIGLVACTIALAMGLQETGPEYGRDLLLEQLQGKHLLLVLDNFEQVIGAAPLVADLLEACPGLTLLLTSRVALQLRGEQQFPLAPLPVPNTTCPSPDALSCCPSVRLFVSRAQAVQPDFDLSDDNGAAISDICCRLDGLPLALELAAARIRLLPPPALAARLQRSLSALSAGFRDLPARQQTLQATLDWSYGLLSPVAQRCLARLSVFAGGFSLEAAEAICDPAATLDMLDVIDSLVANSLVQQTERAGEPRFVMLQMVREYAHEHLTAAGEAEEVHRLHASYYAARAERRLAAFHAEQQAWLEEWAQEHENLRAALHWAWDADAELGLRLAASVWRFWLLRSHLKEARTLLEGLLERAPAAPRAIRAEVAAGAASLVLAQGDEARAAYWGHIALDLYREEGHDAGAAEMLDLLGATA